jgi:hypothetical protein
MEKVKTLPLVDALRSAEEAQLLLEQMEQALARSKAALALTETLLAKAPIELHLDSRAAPAPSRATDTHE